MDTNADIDRFSSFFEELSQLEGSLAKRRIREEIARNEAFFKQLEIQNNERLRHIESAAPDYNVFDIIKVSTYEALVHTPFLANLLSPNGTHGQDRLFFDSFMQRILGGDYDPSWMEFIQVSQEVSSYCGRLDIEVRYRYEGKAKALVIENKIYHHDGEEQLARYFQYLTKILGLGNGDFHLAYLTLDGSKPEIPTSLSQDLYNKLIANKSLLEIGYNKHIIPWLYGISPEIKAPVVRQTVLQYIDALKKL